MNGHHEKKRLENPPAKFKLKIQRRANEGSPEYWETFELPYRRNLNVISVLMDIRKNPVTADGNATTPPVWDMSCLEQVCGICTMVIDGRVRQSCSALIDDLLLESRGDTITLQPMSKFPNVRDLKVDRSRMFDHLKQVHAWIELDGSYDLGPGPAHIERNCSGALCLLTMHDLRMLSRSMPAILRRQLHRPAGDRTGAPFQHAPDRRDHKRRPLKRPDGRGWDHELRQRAKLYPGLPNVDPADKSDLRNQSRCDGKCPLRLAA